MVKSNKGMHPKDAVSMSMPSAHPMGMIDITKAPRGAAPMSVTPYKDCPSPTARVRKDAGTSMATLAIAAGC